ncbi:hypothetical protein NLX67_22195 [Domibacillus sp. A3M-37]|uniref:hypothetical protein n=1 Tax=Domibacillus sp. A3M-37 TaxID=2962037 RepID=UPI0020B78DCF|nr:hypothetical protein [Domibacillus sp. A3M-37]MCP3765022.1 hypothetical protein [Domibacillus sp. A3M-37]
MAMSYLEAQTEVLRRLEDGDPLYFREIDKDVYNLIDPDHGTLNYLYCNRYMQYDRHNKAFIKYGYRDKRLRPYERMTNAQVSYVVDLHAEYLHKQSGQEESAKKLLESTFTIVPLRRRSPRF